MNDSDKIKLSKYIAWIAGVVSLFVALLLLINFIQSRTHQPLESETLKILVERLADDPNNTALKEDIRTLDLLVRKAYFTNIWQIKSGSWILLVSSIILVIALRLHYAWTSKILPPSGEDDNENQRYQIQKWVMFASLLIFISAFVAAYLSTKNLNPEGSVAKVESEPVEDENIEVLEMIPSTPYVVDSVVVPHDAIIAETEIKETPHELSEFIAEGVETKPEEENETVPVEEKKPLFADAIKLKKEFNAFRGYNSNGISYHKNVPISWDVTTGEGVLWKTKVPLSGFNSPVIWEDDLFVTGASASQRAVYCYSASTGALKWEKKVTGIPGSPATPPKTSDDTGLAAPSVTTNGELVFAIFGTGNLISLTMKGEQVWAKNLGVPDNHYGHSSSLVYYKEKLLVQYDTNKGAKVMALHVKTGEVIWSTPRNVKISWASPVLAKIDGRMQVVLSSNPIVAGYDVETGTELWSYDCMMGEVGPSVTYANGLLIATNEYATLVAFKPGETPQVAWENDEYLAEVASPVVSDGLLFVATSYGVLVCYDVHTGKKYWEKEFDEGFYSSPMISCGNLYIADLGGVMHILKVDREAKKVADVSMGEGVYATPSFTDGRIYIRTTNYIYCIGIK